jgi:hypothetical protein
VIRTEVALMSRVDVTHRCCAEMPQHSRIRIES